jgi:hypothetical protein
MTRNYERCIADAAWCRCSVCGAQAALSIRVNCKGRYGRKGSRSLGIYCEEHGAERLKKLRDKRNAEK